MRFSFEGNGCFPTGRHYPGIAHLMRVVAAGLAEEFDAQTPIRELPLASIDTETTGRDFDGDRVVEFACVVFRAGELIARHSWLINPEREIPAEAIAVHGITNDDVKQHPPFRDLVDDIVGSLRGSVPLAYNAEFDQAFILKELGRAPMRTSLPPAARKNVQWVDPLIWARHLHAEAKSKSLGAMCEALGIELENAHRATDDAAAAGRLFHRFLDDDRVPTTYGAFMLEQQRLGRLQAEQRQYWR
jgi:DNA polymerase III subunit epsilon